MLPITYFIKETNNTFPSAKSSPQYLRKPYQNQLQSSRQKGHLNPTAIYYEKLLFSVCESNQYLMMVYS